MSKNLNFNLSFTADTQKAKAQLQDLQNTLTNLSAGQGITTSMNGLTEGMQRGIAAAAELKVKLQEATNVNTGKLDLGKFNQSLRDSNMTLKQYSAQLRNLGPAGAQAFSQVAQAISNADAPLIRVGARMRALGTVIKNTAKWQISSAVLTGITSAVSNALDYAKDLNESLNNIRIVTGKSVEEMDKFAKKAGEAAKALKSTTVAYTDAALIYYQQGLSDAEVLERTNATVKMAQVLGESAETVSNWMTSIWNNFDNGSKSLEYYSDVLVKLGATTASSADEISQGLEKFSSIANTVGLSYEYAAAALATVTSETRQSADVVGTAFKTLFARMQDLKLGETLEDGTTLGQYSEAMAKVGVNIQTASGELKSMDTILNELGGRWQTLDNDQQVALAKSVAGLRQYNQFISLMANWDKFQMNVGVAETSEGQLEEQFDIYAESWEAANKKVKASAEGLYDSLLNDKFFIKLTDNFSKLLDGVTSLIKAMGGMPGLLSLITMAVFKFAGPEISNGFKTLQLNIKGLTKSGQEELIKLKEQAWKLASNMNVNDGSQAGSIRADNFLRESQFQKDLLENQKNLTAQELETVKVRMDGIRIQQSALESNAKELDQLDAKNEKLKLALELQSKGTIKDTKDSLADLGQSAASLARTELLGEEIHSDTTQGKARNVLTQQSAEVVKNFGGTNVSNRAMDEFLADPTLNADNIGAQLGSKFGLDIDSISKDIESYNQLTEAILKAAEAKKKLTGEGHEKMSANKSDAVKEASEGLIGASRAKVKEKVGKTSDATKIDKKDLVDYVNVQNQRVKTEKKLEKSGKNLQKNFKNLQKDLNKGKKNTISWNDALTKSIQGIGSVAFGLNSITSGISSFANAVKSGKVTFSDFLSLITSMSMGIPALISGFNTLKSTLLATNTVQQITNSLQAVSLLQNRKLTKAKQQQFLVEKLGMTQAQASNIVDAARLLLNKKMTAEKKKEQLATLLNISAEQAENLVKAKNIPMAMMSIMLSQKSAAAKNKETTSIFAKAGAHIAEGAAALFAQAAMFPLLAITLILIAAIASLVLIVVALVAAFKAMSDAYNKDAIAAEKAAETARNLKKAYEEAKQAYDDLISAINERQSAVDSLKELTKGTTEWTQALYEANTQTLALIDKYPELQKYATVNADGLMEISDEGLNYVKEVEENRLSTSYNTMLQGKVQASKAQNKADATAAKREMFGTTGGAAAKGIAQAQVASIVASTIPIIGPTIAVAAQGIGAIATAKKVNDVKEQQASVDTAVKALTEDITALASYDKFAEMMAEQGVTNKETLKVLYDNKDVLKELVDNEKKAAAEQLAAQKAIVANIVQGNNMAATSEHSSGIQKIAEGAYKEAYDKAYEQAKKDVKDRDVIEQYMADRGLSNKEGYKLLKNSKDGSVEYEYIDENGEKKKETIGGDEVAQYLAQQQASNDLNSKIDQLAIRLEGQDKGTSDLLGSLAVGDAGDIKGTTLDSAGSAEELLSDLGMGLTDFYGEGATMEEFGEDYNKLLKDTYGIDIAQIEENRLKAQALIDQNKTNALAATGQAAGGSAESVVNNMTASQGENFVAQLQEMTDFYGDTGVASAITDSTNSFAESLDPEAAAAFYDVLGGVTDLDNAEQWDELNTKMRESGKLTYEQQQALVAYTEAAKAAAKATKAIDLKKLTESLKGLESGVESALSGQIDYSEEEYNMMIENGLDPDKFAKTLDGFRYLGDASELAKDLAGAQANQVQDALNSYQNMDAQLKQAEANTAAAMQAMKDGTAPLVEDSQITTTWWQRLFEDIKNVWQQVCNFFSKLWQDICSFFQPVIDAIKSGLEKVKQFFIDLYDGLVGIWNAIVTWLEDIINKIVKLFRGEQTEDITIARAKTSEELERERLAAQKAKEEAELRAKLEEEHKKTIQLIEMSADTYNTVQEIEVQRAGAANTLEELEQEKYRAIRQGKDTADIEERIKRQQEIIDAWDKAIDSKKAADEKAIAALEFTQLYDEIEYFHEILQVLEDINRELDILSTRRERAFGSHKLSYLDAEIAKQEQLIAGQEEYLRQIEEKYTASRNTLLSNYGVELDASGRISNYEEVYQQQLNRVAEAQKLHATKNLSDAGLQAIEQEYEAFTKNVENYETFLNSMEEQTQSLEEFKNTLADKRLEKIEIKLDIQLEIGEDQLSYLDFLMQTLEDDAFAFGEKLSIATDKANLSFSNIVATEESIQEIMSDIEANGGEITQAHAEKLRDLRDSLIDYNEELLEHRELIQESLTEAYESWNDKIDESFEKFDHYSSALENYKNIIDIVGKDMLGISDDIINDVSQAMIASQNNAIRSAKAQLDANKDILQSMREARQQALNANDEESVKEWDEQIKIAEEKAQELEETLNEALSTGLDLAAENFNTVVTQIAENFGKLVSGIYDSIEEMRSHWDRQGEVAERFLTQYEQTYELNKLNRQIQKEIDKTDNTKSQKELRAIQSEMLEMSKDNSQLSKNDLTYLQKKYDLLLAEQALRDAQNAKNTVKLQRDSQGNFGYVYTANENDISQAEQSYEDKLYAFQQYTQEMDKQLAEMYITIQEQAQEKMMEAAEMYGEGTAEFEKARAEILNQYNTDMGYITQEYQKLTNRNLEINQNFNAGVATTYQETYLNSILPNYESFEQLYEQTTENCKISSEKLGEAIEELQKQIKTSFDLAGKDFNNFEAEVTKDLGNIQSESDKTAEEIKTMSEEMNSQLDTAIIEVIDFQTKYSNQMSQVRTNTQSTITTINSLISAYNNLAKAAKQDFSPDLSGAGTGPGSTVIPDTDDGLSKLTTATKIKGNYTIGGREFTQLEDGSVFLTSALNINSNNNTATVKSSKVVTDATGTSTEEYVGKSSYIITDDKIAAINIDDGWVRTSSGKYLPTRNITELKVGQNVIYSSEEKKKENEAKAFEDISASFSVSNADSNKLKEKIPIYLKSATGNGYSQSTSSNITLQTLKDNGYTVVRFSKINAKYGDSGSLIGMNFYPSVNGDPNGDGIVTHINIARAYTNASEKILNHFKSLDTGGYTGAWGPEGRLALLHQKEIVLNAHDTENFLSAIELVRNLSERVDLTAASQARELAAWRANVGSLLGTSGELAQNIVINAEFPAATDRYEIEEAFKSLALQASQYASKN